jgi:hypothetical protein
MSPLNYTEYRKFIRDQIEDREGERGYQGKLAAAARCQKSYFSQILKGDANLNLDQAMGLAEFWGLSEVETQYFLDLVSLARSQYPPLVRAIKERLRKMVEAHERDAKSSGASEIIANTEWLYYSQWYWSAIHILVGIPKFQSVTTISKALNLEEALVETVLLSLKQQGLVEQSGSSWLTKPGHRHLSAQSPLNAMNHSNWRQRAVLNSQRSRPDPLHYTSIQSHSRSDSEAIKKVFLEAIAKSRSIIRPSPNEEMTAICLDFFRVTG